MKVLHFENPTRGDILLDISTAAKETAGYLYMFRYCQKYTGWCYKMDSAAKIVEQLHMSIGELQQKMKEMFLLHGKDKIRLWLSDQHRTIKHQREEIQNIEVLMPIWEQALKGDGKAAKRLFTDRSLNGSPLQVNYGSHSGLRTYKVCDPRHLAIPANNCCSPSVLLDEEGCPA